MICTRDVIPRLDRGIYVFLYNGSPGPRNVGTGTPEDDRQTKVVMQRVYTSCSGYLFPVKSGPLLSPFLYHRLCLLHNFPFTFI